MRCDKCGYINGDYSIICEKCGTPLNIENNNELSKKYNSKPPAIEIIDITPDNHEETFNATKKRISKLLLVLIIFVAFLTLILVVDLIKNIRSKDLMTKYYDFMAENSVGVLYFGSSQEANDYLQDYAETYDVRYLYINTSKLPTFKKNKISRELHLDNLKNSIVIVENGKVLNRLGSYDVEHREEALSFLQENSIVPIKLGDPKEIMADFTTAIESNTPMIIYYVSQENEAFDKQNEILANFCEYYDINYTYIKGYYLADNQKLNLLGKLNYNELQGELVILVDEKKVLYIMDDVSSDKKDYFEIASNYGIIDTSSAESLTNINLDKLKELVKQKDKNVILMGTTDCIYCDRLKPIIGKIMIQNNLNGYYYEVNSDLDMAEEYLKELGYVEGKLTFPLVLITENNNLVDYIIGLSKKTYYEMRFKELGVIR